MKRELTRGTSGRRVKGIRIRGGEFIDSGWRVKMFRYSVESNSARVTVKSLVSSLSVFVCGVEWCRGES